MEADECCKSGSDCRLGAGQTQLEVVEAMGSLSSRIVFPSFLPNWNLVEDQEGAVMAHQSGAHRSQCFEGVEEVDSTSYAVVAELEETWEVEAAGHIASRHPPQIHGADLVDTFGLVEQTDDRNYSDYTREPALWKLLSWRVSAREYSKSSTTGMASRNLYRILVSEGLSWTKDYILARCPGSNLLGQDPVVWRSAERPMVLY